jgi:hypothetical protein
MISQGWISSVSARAFLDQELPKLGAAGKAAGVKAD